MSTYKEIFGKPIKVVSSDPTDAGAEGQIWYNSTLGSFRSIIAAGTWSAGGNMNTARRLLSGLGTQTASLGFGGYVGPSTNASEEYNGTSWTNSPNYPSVIYGEGAIGTQTAGVGAGGYLQPTTSSVNTTQDYNGSSWGSGSGTLGTARNLMGASGVETAGLIFGGFTSYPTVTGDTEEYDGSSYSEQNNMSTARAELASANQAPQTASLAFGGNIPPVNTSTPSTEEYDGSSWTSGGALSTSRFGLGGGGTQTAAIAMTGRNSPPNTVVSNTELYNGTSWSTANTVTTARGQVGGGGTSTLGIVFGGSSTTVLNSTEEFTSTIFSPIPATWSSGGTASVSSYNLGGAGTKTAALAMGGANSTGTGSLTSTEEYNGSGWSTAEDLPGATSYTGGCGTQTAALLAGGGNIPTYSSTTTREYDGTNWTSGGNLNTATGLTNEIIGIQTAALICGGDRIPVTPRSIANVEEYNGSAWTAVTALPAARQYQGNAGIQTAGLVWSGYIDSNPATPNAVYTSTLEYDGSSWTSGGTVPISMKSPGGSGTQTDAISFGGNPNTTPTNITTVLNYNGTSWAANPASLASGRQHMASSSSGPSTAAFAAKGVTTAVTATMEEFTGEIPALAYKTVSSS